MTCNYGEIEEEICLELKKVMRASKGKNACMQNLVFRGRSSVTYMPKANYLKC